MLKNTEKIKKIYLNYRLLIFSILSFSIPFIIYILTLQKKLVGGDTTWYALQLPAMEVMVPTGYPAFSIIGKLFSMIPVGELAYRLNFISAIFGGLTILFLFLAINKFTKNSVISFAGSLTFAFLLDYWTVANRLEFDTMNSFFIAIIIYSMVLYTENPGRKNLYFFAAALGLSLTNHPIAFFIMPAFILYVVLVKPGMFKSAKSVLTGILFFLMPLTLYVWLPIRSLQGYGPVTSLKNFIYYITGKDETGRVHGGSFDHWSIKSFSDAGSQFIKIIYANLGPVLLIIALLGLIYLFRKNWKLAISSIFLIILNFTITALYLGWTPNNYTINVMMILSIYLSLGFLLIYDKITTLFEIIKHKRISGHDNDLENKNRLKKINLFNYIIVIIIFISFLASPILLAVKNYERADFSKPLEIYAFWNEIFDRVENNSIIYVFSASANIGLFINIYERPEKNITFIQNKDEKYNAENVKKDLAEGRKIYFVGIEDKLVTLFNVKKITSYYWERMGEQIILYDYEGEKKDIKIVPNLEKKDFSFGKKLEIEYRIINDNDADLEITSIEMALSGNLNFIGVNQEGTIGIDPSMVGGKYMWVKSFPIKAKSEINIILILRAISPGKAEIDFKVTSQDYYFGAELVEINISD